MADYADLEIKISHGDSASYLVELRYNDLDEAEIRPPERCETWVDLAALGSLRLDPEKYGQALSKFLFGDPQTRLWDAASGQPRGELLIGHSNGVDSVAFSPDSATLASGLGDGSITLWDVASGQPRGELLTGDSSGVYSVAFSPDGRTLASGLLDGSILLWDAASGQPLGEPLIGHTSGIRSLAFSPDGGMLVSGSGDGTLRLWDSDLERWVEAICRKVGRNLTRVEWDRYLSWKGPYESSCSQWPWPWPGGE